MTTSVAFAIGLLLHLATHLEPIDWFVAACPSLVDSVEPAGLLVQQENDATEDFQQLK